VNAYGIPCSCYSPRACFRGVVTTQQRPFSKTVRLVNGSSNALTWPRAGMTLASGGVRHGSGNVTLKPAATSSSLSTETGFLRPDHFPFPRGASTCSPFRHLTTQIARLSMASPRPPRAMGTYAIADLSAEQGMWMS